MQKNSSIFVAGGSTLIGSALLHRLRESGYTNICNSVQDDLDEANQKEVNAYFELRRPEYVFVAAGMSGGIACNQQSPASLMYHNLIVTTNLINAAWQSRATRLLYLASSCSYPRLCPQPMRPEHLLTASLEPTNESYAVAKIAGIKLCQAYRHQYGADMIVGIPANAFGPRDDFDPENSHVCAGLIRRMHEAKLTDQPSFSVWGSGNARREFIYVDDLADACIFAMQCYSSDVPLNLAGGEDVSIRELAEIIRDVVGFRGQLEFDSSKPDGMPLKRLDSAPLAELGFRPCTSLRDAIASTYEWFLGTEDARL